MLSKVVAIFVVYFKINICMYKEHMIYSVVVGLLSLDTKGISVCILFKVTKFFEQCNTVAAMLQKINKN